MHCLMFRLADVNAAYIGSYVIPSPQYTPAQRSPPRDTLQQDTPPKPTPPQPEPPHPTQYHPNPNKKGPRQTPKMDGHGINEYPRSRSIPRYLSTCPDYTKHHLNSACSPQLWTPVPWWNPHPKPNQISRRINHRSCPYNVMSKVMPPWMYARQMGG
jgi:hypothetical protein